LIKCYSGASILKDSPFSKFSPPPPPTIKPNSDVWKNNELKFLLYIVPKILIILFSWDKFIILFYYPPNYPKTFSSTVKLFIILLNLNFIKEFSFNLI